MLVAICDDITGSVTSAPQLTAGAQPDAIDAIIKSVGAQFDGVLYDNVVSAAGVIAKAAESKDTGITPTTEPEIEKALWQGVTSVTKFMEGQSGTMSSAANPGVVSQFKSAVIGAIDPFGLAPQALVNPSIEDISNNILREAGKVYKKASEDMAKNARKILQLPVDGAQPDPTGKGQANWTALEKAMAPRPINGAAIARPTGVIKTAAYITLVYVAIGIWSLPIAVLFWAALAAFPTEWFSGILYSGMKVPLGIILTVFLSTTFIAAAINVSINKSSQLERVVSSPSGGNIINLALWWSNTTVEEVAMTILILGSPLMAAGILKGSNGIAETAKKAMLAGGAYGAVQSVTGKFGSYGTMAGGNNTPSRSDFTANQGSKPG